MKLFLVLIILTSFLRFFSLSSLPSGLYWDEMDTGYQAYSLLQTGKDYFGNLFPVHLQAFADYRSGLYMYLTVPLVKFFGLSALAVRLPAAVFSLISLFFVYYLAKKYLNFGKLSWLPVMVMAFAPWLMIQGRIAAESTLVVPFLLLGLIGFFEFLKNQRRLWLASLGFSLLLWSYGTPKIFLPLFLLSLLIIYRKRIVNFQLSIFNFFLPVLIFLIICAPVVIDTFTKPIAFRMAELSVFTDPTTSTETDFRRLQAGLGAGKLPLVGMSPSLLEKAVYNKPTSWFSVLVGNYARSLSTDFLFLAGDPQLRHNLNQVNTGQFYLVELVPFLLGLFYLFSKLKTPNSKLFLTWLLISPLPSIITRDGGNHGPRLLFLFPVIALIISYGLKSLSSKKFPFIMYMGIYLLSVFLSVYYFRTSYRVKSAFQFNTGFTKAIELALKKSPDYDRVIIDTHNENALMAYLFVAKPNPAVFQKSFPIPSEDVANGVSGYKFENVVLLFPGTRNWQFQKISGKNLIIAASDVPGVSSKTPLDSVLNPDSSNAFVSFGSSY